MKKRTRKILSLLLAASMVFSMNTVAFAEEIVTDDAAEISAEATDGEVLETAGDPEESGEIAADAELNDAALTGTVIDVLGIAYDENDNPITKIKFDSNGDKKDPVDNVATITHTTDPLSWNNFYGAGLIKTVIDGSNKQDHWLTNKEEFLVSENNSYDIENYRGTEAGERYASIKVDNGIYLFLEYGVQGFGASNVFVSGHTKFIGSDVAPLLPFEGDLEKLNKSVYGYTWKITNQEKPSDDEATAAGAYTEMIRRIGSVPSVEWDGRKITWDKDNKYSATKTQREALYVRAALVKYEGSTLTEIPGAEVTQVKIDPKTIKKASIENASTMVGVDVKYYDTLHNKEQTAKAYVGEAKLLGTLPTFKVTVKAKGKDSKQYNKKIKEALNKESFEFGIYQRGVVVNDPTTAGIYDNEYYTKDKLLTDAGEDPVHYIREKGKTDTAAADTLSGCEIKSLKIVSASKNDITKKDGVQDMLVEAYGRGGYIDGVDYKDMQFARVWDEYYGGFRENGFRISKFNNDKAVVTEIVNLYKDGYYTGQAEIKLKPKKDYTLTENKLAGEDVYVFDFVGDNYTYSTTYNATDCNLGVFGYKYAFRKTPGEKSKTFRAGIFADSEVGFVYNAE